jgi:hypothetical protein
MPRSRFFFRGMTKRLPTRFSTNVVCVTNAWSAGGRGRRRRPEGMVVVVVVHVVETLIRNNNIESTTR